MLNRGKIQEVVLNLTPGAHGNFVARSVTVSEDIDLDIKRDDVSVKVYVDSFKRLVVEVS
jgi:hypothetical protein